MRTFGSEMRIGRGVDQVRALIASLYEIDQKPKLAYGISNMDVLERIFPEYSISSGNPARLEAGVASRFIYTSSRGPVYGMSDHLLNRKSKFLPPERLAQCGDITIVENTVVFVAEQAGEVQAHAITSPTLANQMRGLFNYLWNCG